MLYKMFRHPPYHVLNVNQVQLLVEKVSDAREIVSSRLSSGPRPSSGQATPTATPITPTAAPAIHHNKRSV